MRREAKRRNFGPVREDAQYDVTIDARAPWPYARRLTLGRAAWATF